jgi:TRAP-type transport system periplasmic protein
VRSGLGYTRGNAVSKGRNTILKPSSFKLPLIAIIGLGIVTFTTVAATAQSKITLRFGHSSQTAEPNQIFALAFAKDLSALTNGRVDVKIYPQAQLGDEKALVEQLRLGTVVASKILVGFVPDFVAIGLPFAFCDYGQAHEFLDGLGGKTLLLLSSTA